MTSAGTMVRLLARDSTQGITQVSTSPAQLLPVVLATSRKGGKRNAFWLVAIIIKNSQLSLNTVHV